MQFPVCAPWITEHMLKPEYWIEQVKDTEDLIALIARSNDVHDRSRPTADEWRKKLFRGIYNCTSISNLIIFNKLKYHPYRFSHCLFGSYL